MKHLLWLLLLPLAAHAACSPGPNWCIAAPVLSATSVTAGSPITVTMAFTSVAAVTNETLDIEVWDAGNPSAKVPGCQLWQTGINFTAGQTVTETASCTIPATATTALYTVNVGLFEASGMQDFYGFVTNFTVNAATPPAPPPVPPPCYSSGGVGLTITLNPPAYTDWLAAANPSWIMTWFCPSATDPTGYVGNSLYGYRSEMLPNWAALITGSKAALDALWKTNLANPNDAELAPAANAQLQATWPQPLKTTGTTVYYVIQQPDKYVPVPVGTAPVGTSCNRSQSVDGMYGVPVASVTWYGTVKPLSVVAPCG